MIHIKTYHRYDLKGVSVATHHSSVIHEVGVTNGLLFSATSSTESCGYRAATCTPTPQTNQKNFERPRACKLPPNYEKKDLPAGRRGPPLPREGQRGTWGEGEGAEGRSGQRSPFGTLWPRGWLARPAGHRHSQLGGGRRRSVLRAGGQGAGPAAVGVGDGGGRRHPLLLLRLAGGQHGGVRPGRGGPGPQRPGGSVREL